MIPHRNGAIENSVNTRSTNVLSLPVCLPQEEAEETKLKGIGTAKRQMGLPLGVFTSDIILIFMKIHITFLK
jgi:hypothetical protein